MSQSCRLWCLVYGESTAFNVTAHVDTMICDLKELIYSKCRHGIFLYVDLRDLILWKLDESELIKPAKTLADRIGRLGYDLSEFAGELEPTDTIAEAFTEHLSPKHLHIIVQPRPGVLPTLHALPGWLGLPTSSHADLPARPYSLPTDLATVRALIDNFVEKIRPKIKDYLSKPRLPVWTPPETVDMETKEFYRDLAIPCTKGNRPSLLLHDLGNGSNCYVDKLFQHGEHRILCNASGTGKTRLLFEGLCKHWGFYFVAAQDAKGIGMKDLELVIDRMRITQGWVEDIFKAGDMKAAMDSNEDIAFNLLSSVLLARWIVFHVFIKVARDENDGELPDTIKHDWLLFQILPSVCIGQVDPFFALIIECLDGAPKFVLGRLLYEFGTTTTLQSAFDTEKDTFFYVLDEAQVAGKVHMGAFADENGKLRRPVLHPIVHTWVRTTASYSTKFIVSGTGFSLDLFKTVLISGLWENSNVWDVVHMMGDFNNQEKQKSFITRYLPQSFLHSQSGAAILSRMFEWLRGRHRFTAKYLEDLISGAWTTNSPSSPHKLLDAYVKACTTFSPIDGNRTLLAAEPDVEFPKVEGFPWDKLGPGLLEELSNLIYTFMTQGEYPMWYSEHNVLVEHGLARFMKEGSDDAIIEEPMALLSILRHFEKEGYAPYKDIRSCMQYAKGHAFEEAVLISCTKLFQQGTRLDQVFQFHGKTPEWACQEASIVTRLNGETLERFDIASGNPVIPSASVYLARDPKDVENWIKSMKTGWCVPGKNIGPDLMTWFRLRDGRLLLGVFQAKCHLTGNVDTIPDVTAKAIRSLSPEHFFSALESAASQKEISDMLNSINNAQDCFTGGRYNILRVIVTYQLDGNLNSKSKKVHEAIEGDNHPLAALRHDSLLSSLACCNSTPSILPSLSTSLKRLRGEDYDGEADVGQPSSKLRMMARSGGKSRWGGTK